VLEAAVLERMVNVIALIVRPVVAVPVVLVDVRRTVNAAGVISLWFGLGARIVPLGGGGGTRPWLARGGFGPAPRRVARK